MDKLYRTNPFLSVADCAVEAGRTRIRNRKRPTDSHLRPKNAEAPNQLEQFQHSPARIFLIRLQDIKVGVYAELVLIAAEPPVWSAHHALFLLARQVNWVKSCKLHRLRPLKKVSRIEVVGIVACFDAA